MKIIKLEQNYRSTQNILGAASGLISKNNDRVGKKLWTDSKDGELVKLTCYKNGREEATGIASYGSDNDMRLTGLHETQSIDTFSFGVSDRGASIRIPIYTVEHNWNGYLEDRRPASNADPYKVIAHIVSTLS